MVKDIESKPLLQVCATCFEERRALREAQIMLGRYGRLYSALPDEVKCPACRGGFKLSDAGLVLVELLLVELEKRRPPAAQQEDPL